MKQRWKYPLYASALIVGGGLLFILVQTVRAQNTGFEVKTLWDWMDLLIIPLVLAGGAFYLNRSERNTEREIATDRQQEVALQTYLDRMTELLLEKKLATTKDKKIRDVARIRTLTVLRSLDAVRKGLIVSFLYEANLINAEKPVLKLLAVDLEGVDLRGKILRNIDFQAANLQGAQLHRTFLPNANLLSARLSDADLSLAELSKASLRYAIMQKANLVGAILHGADLEGATLKGADLKLADLRKADLRNADLRGAKLERANLQSALVRKEQLTTVQSLKGATMPDGTIHE